MPFLIPAYRVALVVAIIVIALELTMRAVLRWRFFNTGVVRSFAALGGAIIAVVSAALDGAAG